MLCASHPSIRKTLPWFELREVFLFSFRGLGGQWGLLRLLGFHLSGLLLEVLHQDLVLLNDEVTEGRCHGRGVPRDQVGELGLGLDLVVL